MVKWLPGQAGLMKKFHVKLKPLKLEGFHVENENERIVQVKVKWIGPKPGLVPFYRSSSRQQRNYTGKTFLRKGEFIGWDDEFERVCRFPIVTKDGSFGSWDVSFDVLYGDSTESNASKLAVLGRVPLNLAELASKMESKVKKKLPITLQVGGVRSEATLLVCVSFTEVRSHDSQEIVQNWAESEKADGFFKIVRSLTGYKKKKKEKKSQEDRVSWCDSDESAVFDSSELGSSPRLDPVKVRLFSWKRRKQEPFIEKNSVNNDNVEICIDRQKADHSEFSSKLGHGNAGCIASDWEVRELVSRDGQAKLKANVFFASFDQRSEKAAGESACTALVAVIAHWLHSNDESMPTSPEFDSLITEGSSLWRNLCDNEAYTNFFPDKHFDLETVLEADLRPISVLRERSFTGFFSPEKFDYLKEAMSFDQIWNVINSNTDDYEPRVYIVSWNDHFFVLKVEANAYYIIDSLGERLFEGCNQAYILKFDESTLMYGKAVKEEADHEEESEEIICSGKECCREYIKRFLAAIPLGELEEEEKKGTISPASLLQRLQIDFNYCFPSSSSSSSSSTTLSPCSIFSSEEGI